MTQGYKLLIILWMTVLVSGFGVIYVGHQCRLLVSELARLQQQENNLQMVWGQYLLEQSSLSNLTLIESTAKRDLGMKVPQINEVVMVQP